MSAFVVKLPVPLHPELVGDVAGKLAYVHEGVRAARVDSSRAAIHVEVDDAAIAPVVEARILAMVAKMAKGFRPPKRTTTEPQLFHEELADRVCDATPALMETGALREEARGLYQLGPVAAGLYRYVESRLHDVARAMGALPHQFPALIAPSVLHRASYFKAFPHSLSVVKHVRSDLERIEAFSNEAQRDFASVTDDVLSPPKALLSPAVCFHLYDMLQGKTLPKRYLAQATGKCFRYEAGNLSGIDRLWDFTMFEIITVGRAADVLEQREVGRNALAGVLRDLEINHAIEIATDPFFVGEFAVQASFQSAFELKYEIQAHLPGRSKTLAIGSFNYHQDHFGKAFSIKADDGEPAHTGCTAFGLERWVAAFVSQHGVDPAKWPEQVRRGAGLDERG